ncbi:hypothetical protein ASG24_08665 [Methylophilus sp. Leaf414]|nr:hypothetical protein ASG24_08665 [Methylophilus sp. Leaf414]
MGFDLFVRHSFAGCIRGFIEHALCLRNGWLMQKPARPARENLGEMAYRVMANYYNARYMSCRILAVASMTIKNSRS